MFSKRKPANANGQIPYTVFETAQYGHTRRFRWLYQLAVAVIVIAILVLGAIWLYRLSHGTVTPKPLSQNTSRNQNVNVQQSPQTNTTLNQSAGNPSQTKASNSTNDTNVPPPKN